MWKTSITAIILLVIPGCMTAQEMKQLGSWNTHLAYNKANQVGRNNEQVLCVVENGLFFYDMEDGNLNKLTRTDGLNDVGISAVYYDEESEKLALGYLNGNIDIIMDMLISNIDDLKNSEVSYSKSIIDIEKRSQLYYFITEFGVLVYDEENRFIKEAWRNLDENGDFLKINRSTIRNDTIFLATEKGVIAGSLNPEINLLDFRNWKRYGIEDGLPENNTSLIESFNNVLYAVQEENLIYRNSSGSFSESGWMLPAAIKSLKATEEYLSITLEDRIAISDRNEVISYVSHDLIKKPMDSQAFPEGIWVADNLNGLVYIEGDDIEAIFPNGPFINNIKKIIGFEDYIIALPPGYTNNFQPLRNGDGFSAYSNGQWKNYNNSTAIKTNPFPEITDLVDVTYLESAEQAYFASFGYGIITWDLENEFHIPEDGTLVNSSPPGANVLVSAIHKDRDNTVWMTNFNSQIPLHSLSPDNAWNEYTIPLNGSQYLNDILVLENGDKWMSVIPALGGGIIVYNEEDSNYRYLNTEEGNGGLPDNNITDMVQDRKGQVWLTTSKGVAYFPFPIDVLSNISVDAILPIYNQNFLFRNERVNTIAVDGGNRKWMGTAKGAWLFDEDGIFLIENFNMENSPLLSENLIDIAINDATGEIFFATDNGINSFRGFATEPEENFNTVKIFPNPVFPSFNGYLGIEGLPENSVIKITDVSGKLVYQTNSNGGLATWDLQDISGNRPDTGIYLVFYSTQEGEETLVGKLSIIN